MKKFLFLAVLMALPCLAENPTWRHQYDVQLSSQNNPVRILSGTPIIFNYDSSGKSRDCFTKLTVTGDNFSALGSSVSFLSNGTTFYSIGWSTGVVTDFWDYHNPLCSPDLGTTTYISVSTGNYKINAIGFTRNR